MDLKERIAEILEMDTGSNDTKVQRRTRWAAVAEAAVEAGPGDIVEIGALAGDSTVLFCDIAERHGRRVLVVDPWIAPTHDVAGWEKAEFEKRTRRWQESGVLEVIEKKSQNQEVIERLVDGVWAFALVDGMHTYGAALGDAMAVRHSRVICFDDLDKKELARAFDQAGLLLPGRVQLVPEAWKTVRKWEGYIV